MSATALIQNPLCPSPLSFSSYPLQTTVTEAEYSTFRAYCLKPVIAEYVHAERALSLSDNPKHPGQLARMKKCRDHAWFVQHSEDLTVRVAAEHCGVRWCPMCAVSRRAAITPGIAAWIRELDRPKFLTLTLKHSPLPLREQVDLLYSSFKRLRKLSWWKTLVRGGIWFFQVKRSRNSKQWHPHFHILLDAEFILHGELSRHWDYLTRGSTVVDIRAVDDEDAAAMEVARYATTPAALKLHGDADKQEILACFQGMRIAGTWGTAKGVPLRPVKQDDWWKWRHIGGFYSLTLRRLSDLAIAAIFKAWQTGHPMPYAMYIDAPEGYDAQSIPSAAPEPAKYLPGFYDQPPPEIA